MFRNFKVVPHIIFGRGSFAQVEEILLKRHNHAPCAHVYIVDDVFKDRELARRIPVKNP